MSRNLSKKRKTTPPIGGYDESNEFEEIPSKRSRSAVNGERVEGRIIEIEEDIKMIKEDKHADLIEEVKKLEKNRDRELKEADVLRDMRHKEVDEMHAFQVKEANDVFESRKKELKEQKLMECEEILKRLKERESGTRRKVGRGRSSSITQENDEESREDDESPVPTHPIGEDTNDTENLPVAPVHPKRSVRISASERKFNPNADFSINYSAPIDQISEDLEKIHAAWIKRAENFHSKEELANLAIRVKDDGKLYYNEQIIEKGANVIVHSETSKADLFGVVTRINPDEVSVKLADGSNSRILLSHLRSGRCKIARDLPKEAANSSSQ